MIIPAVLLLFSLVAIGTVFAAALCAASKNGDRAMHDVFRKLRNHETKL